jgi:hypothetical protein
MFGHAEAGMGVVEADLNGDQLLDLFITHLDGESNILYLNQGPGRGFQDATGRSRTAVSSIPLTGFGVVAFDADLDGDLDLLIANGRVNRAAPRAGSRAPPPLDELAEPKLFYLNDGQAQFSAGGKKFLRCIESSSSYLSCSTLIAHYGLGRVDAVDSIEVLWPDGLKESFAVRCVDCAVELRRGEGKELK